MSLEQNVGQNELPSRLGRYRIAGRIGRGGMARVYQAYDPETESYVALKVMRASLMADNETDRPYVENKDTLAARFRKEVKLMLLLRHPSIVNVSDSGEENGSIYLVMELFQDGSLDKYLARLPQQRLPLEQAAWVVNQIAAGLSYAHEQGVIHRDLKPSNVLLDFEGQRAVLSDFGIAKIITATTQMTRGGLGLGTPNYMAPEQFRSRPEIRSDVYALAALAYRLLAGEPPYTGDDVFQIMEQQRQRPVYPFEHYHLAQYQTLDPIFAQALAFDANMRYAGVTDFVTAFNQASSLIASQQNKTFVPQPLPTVANLTLISNNSMPTPFNSMGLPTPFTPSNTFLTNEASRAIVEARQMRKRMVVVIAVASAIVIMVALALIVLLLVSVTTLDESGTATVVAQQHIQQNEQAQAQLASLQTAMAQTPIIGIQAEATTPAALQTAIKQVTVLAGTVSSDQTHGALTAAAKAATADMLTPKLTQTAIANATQKMVVLQTATAQSQASVTEAALLSASAAAAHTATPTIERNVATPTPLPPTNTPRPQIITTLAPTATATSVPTDTPIVIVTDTPVPPTPTPLVIVTDTPVPPTPTSLVIVDTTTPTSTPTPTPTPTPTAIPTTPTPTSIPVQNTTTAPATTTTVALDTTTTAPATTTPVPTTTAPATTTTSSSGGGNPTTTKPPETVATTTVPVTTSVATTTASTTTLPTTTAPTTPVATTTTIAPPTIKSTSCVSVRCH